MIENKVILGTWLGVSSAHNVDVCSWVVNVHDVVNYLHVLSLFLGIPGFVLLELLLVWFICVVVSLVSFHVNFLVQPRIRVLRLAWVRLLQQVEVWASEGHRVIQVVPDTILASALSKVRATHCVLLGHFQFLSGCQSLTHVVVINKLLHLRRIHLVSFVFRLDLKVNSLIHRVVLKSTCCSIETGHCFVHLLLSLRLTASLTTKVYTGDMLQMTDQRQTLRTHHFVVSRRKLQPRVS